MLEFEIALLPPRNTDDGELFVRACARAFVSLCMLAQPLARLLVK